MQVQQNAGSKHPECNPHFSSKKPDAQKLPAGAAFLSKTFPAAKDQPFISWKLLKPLYTGCQQD
jgi:hypothetical protein